jgi:hypothetical protein
VKLKNIHYFIIKTIWARFRLATGDPDVRTFDLGASFLSYNIPLLKYLCCFINFYIILFNNYFACNFLNVFEI